MICASLSSGFLSYSNYVRASGLCQIVTRVLFFQVVRARVRFITRVVFFFFFSKCTHISLIQYAQRQLSQRKVLLVESKVHCSICVCNASSNLVVFSLLFLTTSFIAVIVFSIIICHHFRKTCDSTSKMHHSSSPKISVCAPVHRGLCDPRRARFAIKTTYNY